MSISRPVMDFERGSLDDRFSGRSWNCESLYNREVFCREARRILSGLRDCPSVEMARERLVGSVRQVDSPFKLP